MFLQVRCPSEFHVNLVRNFIKHYYRFIFGPCEFFVQTANQQSVLQKLNQLKKTLYDSCLLAPISSKPGQIGSKQPLYLLESTQSELVPHLRIMNRICFDFLYYCCQNWAYDLNFEVVNECWLTAIQPWRYQEISLTNTQSKFSSSPTKTTSASPGNASTHQDIAENDLLHWHEAITSQYSLYVVPLVHFLRRMSSMDLNVYQAAHMVFRVAKVLNQPGLKHVLVDVECLLAKELQTQGSISSSSFMRFSTSPLASHNQYNNTGIWSHEMLDLVQQLLATISSSVYKYAHLFSTAYSALLLG
ncbi:sphingomyelin phosphodiesterase 4, neutral membrane (neutral sphingomyelinase-3) [Cichlidogyrus casuarinus]|uniref:Sphingomyelin phosphodiesterase 4, neutral membrane (Neutral sphingomyelinase-3) n=1 Tax=Cichlidogyrus casuarinus TaxID=1844966 RepID=A0ABD2Q398_9PLAT